jgi:hypothetical protein
MKPIVAVAAVALLFAACSSPSAPKFQITLSGPTPLHGFETTESGDSVYQCDYQVTATATGGTAGEVATWTGGREFFQREDGRTSQSTITDAASYWGGNATISSGSTETGYNRAWWNEPFQTTIFFYYSTAQEALDSASFAFDCE